jgi:hypothetical protein
MIAAFDVVAVIGVDVRVERTGVDEQKGYRVT